MSSNRKRDRNYMLYAVMLISKEQHFLTLDLLLENNIIYLTLIEEIKSKYIAVIIDIQIDTLMY